MAYYTEPQEVADALEALLVANQEDLGIEFIDYGEETAMIPKYPAVVVTPGPVERTIAATHQFGLFLHAEIWVHHGDLTATRKERTRADLDLASEIKDLLHEPLNRTLNNKVIFGYVEDMRGGLTVIGKTKSVITSRLAWICESRENF